MSLDENISNYSLAKTFYQHTHTQVRPPRCLKKRQSPWSNLFHSDKGSVNLTAQFSCAPQWLNWKMQATNKQSKEHLLLRPFLVWTAVIADTSASLAGSLFLYLLQPLPGPHHTQCDHLCPSAVVAWDALLVQVSVYKSNILNAQEIIWELWLCFIYLYIPSHKHTAQQREDIQKFVERKDHREKNIAKKDVRRYR